MRDFVRLLEKRKGNLSSLLQNSCEISSVESQRISGAIEEIDFFIGVVEKLHELEILRQIDAADTILKEEAV